VVSRISIHERVESSEIGGAFRITADAEADTRPGPGTVRTLMCNHVKPSSCFPGCESIRALADQAHAPYTEAIPGT
jgi:hypothetical protein